jgi:hypothetical protein
MVARRLVLLACLAGLSIPVSATALPAADKTAARLRYGFEENGQFGYEVKLHVTIGSKEHNREGVLIYDVLKATDDEVVLKTSGTASRLASGWTQTIGPPRMSAPPRFRVVTGPEGTTISRRGSVISSREMTHLPFLLGDLELLAIEEFPEDAKWKDASGTFGVEASLEAFDGQTVALKKDGGKVLRVPLNKLSPSDQAYVLAHARGLPKDVKKE